MKELNIKIDKDLYTLIKKEYFKDMNKNHYKVDINDFNWYLNSLLELGLSCKLVFVFTLKKPN